MGLVANRDILENLLNQYKRALPEVVHLNGIKSIRGSLYPFGKDKKIKKQLKILNEMGIEGGEKEVEEAFLKTGKEKEWVEKELETNLETFWKRLTINREYLLKHITELRKGNPESTISQVYAAIRIDEEF